MTRWVSTRGLQRTTLFAWAALTASGCTRSDGATSENETCPPAPVVSATLVRDPSPLLSPDEGNVCQIDAAGRLSRACLPRCSSAVRASFYACRDPGCEDTTLASDLTPAISAISSGSTRAFDCSACVRQARSFCLSQACPAEAARRDECLARADGGLCAAEATDLSECFLNHQHLYEPCLFLAVETCFSGK